MLQHAADIRLFVTIFHIRSGRQLTRINHEGDEDHEAFIVFLHLLRVLRGETSIGAMVDAAERRIIPPTIF
jgi:hypothetical protein